MPEAFDYDAVLERASVKREISPCQMEEYYARFPRIAAQAALRGGPTVNEMFCQEADDSDVGYVIDEAEGA